MGEFRMPSLGADMEAGTLVEWLKAPGDSLARGDVIAVVETQKGAIEIEVFEDGVLDKSLVEVGTKVPVGTPMAVIRSPGEAEVPGKPAPAKAAPEPKPAKVAKVPKPAAKPAPAPPPAALPAKRAPVRAAAQVAATRLRITPAARRLAVSTGVAPSRLANLAGTGPDGAITLHDVETLAERPATGPAPSSATAPAPLSDMRAAIAAAMARSKREIPHYYLSHAVDLTAAQAFVTAANADRTPEARLLIGAVFLAAVVRALAKYPEFNGHFTEGAFRPGAAVNAAMAVALRGGGLVAPAILAADSCDLDTLMQRMRDVAVRVRAGRFRAQELSEATITITSLGERGVDRLYGVIQPPQVAILGFGCPAEKPIVRDGTVVAALTADVTLAADHRVSDGHRGALFLRAIERHLQDPEAL
jgi:pyruvate dehydrogenase E2 component (dihydrolipoamide acetyltransferase)